MRRRTFLARLGQALAALPVITLPWGCDPAEPDSVTESFTTESSGGDDGHVHELTLTCDSLKGGVPSYFTSDANGHTHVVRLEFDQITRILNDDAVVVDTEPGGHTHTFTLQKPGHLCT